MSEIKHYGLFINNEFVDAADGDTFESLNPALDEPMAVLARAKAADVERAAAGAVEAYERGPWGQMRGAERGRILNRWADLIEANDELISHLETDDNGRPIRETGAQARIVATWYRYFAGLADKIEGQTIPVDRDHLNYTVRVPLGVVGAITPWNHPLLIATKKLAPALAAGNCVLLKPSELAPCSLMEVADLARQAGMPPGVLQVLPGYGQEAGAPLVAHPALSRIDVTGSTATGKAIARVAADTMKRFGGELGGKAPVIVFDDANVDAAVRGTQFSGFIGAGQTCIAGTRILVQRGIYDAFNVQLKARVAAMRVGMPQDPRTQMGPQISAGARDRILGYIELAMKEGARLLVGGGRPSDPALQRGYFLTPTVFVDAENQMRCAQEEIFGPVLLVIPFDTEEEAIRLANDIDYGLGAAIWTQNVARAHRVATAVLSGTIWINDHHRNDPASPWGGFKNSGYGRENGLDAVREFTDVKSIWVNLRDEPVTWYDTDEPTRLN